MKHATRYTCTLDVTTERVTVTPTSWGFQLQSTGESRDAVLVALKAAVAALQDEMDRAESGEDEA